MSCDTGVFSDYLVDCPESIKVNALLLPDTVYKWVITDKFGKEYSGTSTTNSNGFFEIDVEDLPAGLLTAYSGAFALKIFDSANDCQQINFLIGRFFNEIHFSVKPGNNVKDNLGCEFECIGTNGGNSAVFQFTNTPQVDIEWSTLLSSLYGQTPNVQVYHETSPGVYQLANVSVELSGSPLEGITVNNGGSATGYILIS